MPAKQNDAEPQIMVALDSPEFQAAVAQAVQRSIVTTQVPHNLSMVPSTSIAGYRASPGEVTLRFRRYTQVRLTAYQAGQEAGFGPSEAQQLIIAGAASEIHRNTDRRGAA